MQLKTHEFNRISHYMKTHFGINLTDKKRSLIETRLSHMLEKRDFHTYDAYFDHVEKDPSGKELIELLNHLTTNHTYFMREVEHFDFLKKTILPTILDAYGQENDLRIWCAGCSMGHEAYTIAMLVSDFFEGIYPRYGLINKQMLATDISDKVLQIAVSGTYHQDDTTDLPKSWLHKYFHKEGHYYVVKPFIKSLILFRRLNLMNPFPFKKQFHTIFCRNVMIYFDTPTKDALIQRFYDALVPGGYLIIGHSEFINREKSDFDYVCPAVYRKKGGPSHG